MVNNTSEYGRARDTNASALLALATTLTLSASVSRSLDRNRSTQHLHDTTTTTIFNRLHWQSERLGKIEPALAIQQCRDIVAAIVVNVR